MRAALLKVLVSAAVLTILATELDLAEVAEALGAIDPRVLALVVAVQIVQFSVLALRWSLVLAAAGIPVGWWQSFRLLSAALAANQVLPTSLGADLVRAWMIRRLGSSGADALGTVIADRLAGLLALATLGIVTATVADDVLPAGAAWIPWLALAGLIGGIATVVAVVERLRAWPAADRIATAVRRLRSAVSTPTRAAAVAGLSFAAHALTALCLWLVADAAGADIAYVDALALLPPVILGLLIPISIAGWGVREGIVVGGLGLLGTAPETALAASIAWGLATLAAALLAGALWLATRGSDVRAP